MPDTIENILTIAQPLEVSVKVGIEIDSNGQKKPSVEIKTVQHLTIKDTQDKTVGSIVEAMLEGSLYRCKDTIKKAMEE